MTEQEKKDAYKIVAYLRVYESMAGLLDAQYKVTIGHLQHLINAIRKYPEAALCAASTPAMKTLCEKLHIDVEGIINKESEVVLPTNQKVLSFYKNRNVDLNRIVEMDFEDFSKDTKGFIKRIQAGDM